MTTYLTDGEVQSNNDDNSDKEDVKSSGHQKWFHQHQIRLKVII